MNLHDMESLLDAVRALCDEAIYDDSLQMYTVSLNRYDQLQDIEQRIARDEKGQ